MWKSIKCNICHNYLKMLNNNHIFSLSICIFSSVAADLSDGLVAISIDDSESDANNATTDDVPKNEEEPLLPMKMGYEWKDITQEFFEAVKGKFTQLVASMMLIDRLIFIHD